MEYFKQIYERLDITNNPYGESYYNKYIPEVIKILKEKNLTKMDDGALCMYVKKHKVPLMLIKSDGGFNYDTTDMAAAWVRMVEW
jgi:arginyl-tRNA synthetase